MIKLMDRSVVNGQVRLALRCMQLAGDLAAVNKEFLPRVMKVTTDAVRRTYACFHPHGTARPSKCSCLHTPSIIIVPHLETTCRMEAW